MSKLYFWFSIELFTMSSILLMFSFVPSINPGTSNIFNPPLTMLFWSGWLGYKNSIILDVTGIKLGFSKVTILSNIILVKVLLPFLVNPVSKIFKVTPGSSCLILKKFAAGFCDNWKGFWFSIKVISHK